MHTGPRIYNLFPLLVGSVADWTAHLPRIGGMGFDWIFLNPIHHPGFSGSLYAVKDPYRLHDLFQGGSSDSPDDQLSDFFAQARDRGMSVMMDLVVNHTARDAVLVEKHPEWFRREPDGDLYSPRAVDPVDPSLVTVWGDLAELDYERPDVRAGLVDYWRRYVHHYVRLGVRGFRCDAAYQVPAEVWRALITAARDVNPEVKFFAETLGCTIEQVEALRGAGFDFLFNSAKWWDFEADWLLDQYNRYRTIAPSISFPESHDTDRLAAEVGSQDTQRLAAHMKMRYLFSACFSTGVMVPVGYEYGFTRKLDVVKTRPEDWENPRLDMARFIADVNAMKASTPVLNVEGPQRRITAPDNPAVGLLRVGTSDDGAEGCTVVLINPDETEAVTLDPGPLMAETGGTFDGFRDITPEAAPLPFEPGRPLRLEPLALRVFHAGPEAKRLERAGHDSATVSQTRLEALADERISIENVWPEIDAGRFAVKRVVGDVMEVWADIFTDGRFELGAVVKYKMADEAEWLEAPMRFFDNDRWVGRVALTRNGRWMFTVEAWRDLYESWRMDFRKKHDAGVDIGLELIEGRQFIEQAARAASGERRRELEALIGRVYSLRGKALIDYMLGDEVRATMARCGVRAYHNSYRKELEVYVDRTAARFASWFEVFPRSASGDSHRHGTFDDVIAQLPMVRDMGFDVLYFPPIHPIGKTNRKGRNNSLTPTDEDPGSPYAIGSREGGHTEIAPELGTLEDFRRLVRAAREHELEIALDFAIQCSPDHPWIRNHPEWFHWRPDGTIRFAENPPKKYEDIVNVTFYREAMPSVWFELRNVVLFWVEQGVKTFRVDNPHTKPFPFWEWLIREVQDRHPDVLFLSEAFTRPKPMKRLAKLGFTQSYTYFTWRHTKAELTEYLTELTATEVREYLRPNFFANTPDINPPFLQTGGRPAHQTRAVLAATLSPVYGLYGPYILCEATPVPGKEEYLDSEKYEIRAWDYDQPGNIKDYVTRLNKIRRDNPALHYLDNLRFYAAHDDNVLFYGKMTAAKDNIILVAVNLDPHHGHGATIEVPLHDIGLPEGSRVEVEELFTSQRLSWLGRFQHVWLDAQTNPCAIWRVTPP
ncbi:MAG TPA: maltotransferase domain-containing protein [Azospirillaceae bacterium]|nr:maltotransferase domain-containing protein [Azospirillaceae bacterium]